MGQTPDDIRHDIERTRGEMTDTIQALGYKADVPSRVKSRIADLSDSVKSSASGAAGAMSGTASDAASTVTHAAGTISDQIPSRRQLDRTARSSPWALLFGAVAAGVMLGQAIPSSRKEDELIGRRAEQLRDQARALGQDAVDHGRQVAQDAAYAARDAAADVADQVKSSGHEHAQQLGDQAASRAQDTAAAVSG